MLHCFGCGRDLPDNLAYCLYCGAKLEDDDEPTVVNPPPVPQPSPYEPIPYEPKPGSGFGKFVLGSLLGGLVVLLLLVVGALVLSALRDGGETATNSTNASNSNLNVSIAASPSPAKSATPKKQEPSPSPSDVNDDLKEGKSARECRIVNPQGGTVNIRRNCDTRDCSMDPATLYTQGDPGDTVVPTGRASVTTGRFTWVQVRYRGETLWISSTRMSCE
jgi:hypothetical protein